MNDIRNTIQNNYKEELPLQTVNTIRTTLEGIGFELVENTQNSDIDTYWTKLELRYMDIIIFESGGKGNTPELSLASAYGEMMETIQCNQNGVMRVIFGNVGMDMLDVKEFSFRPDETQVRDIDKYFETSKNIKILESMDTTGSIKDLKNISRNVYSELGYLPLLTYTRYDETDTLDVDEYTLQYIITSTGNAAGNSKYEALIQGLCEVIERYVKFRVFKEDICLPFIPDEVLRKYPYAYNAYTKINNTNRYKLELRDASLGGKFPVVCAILYDREKIGYTVDFGCFPIFNIALDRTINELLQYHKLTNVDSVLSYTPLSIDYDIQELKGNHIVEGDRFFSSNIRNTALYKDRFVGHHYSYDYNGWYKYEIKSNKELFYKLCKDTESAANAQIYYKEANFLGFPAYRVYSPQLSCKWFFELNGEGVFDVQYKNHYEEFLFKGTISKEEFIEKCHTYGISYRYNMIGRNLKNYNLNTHDVSLGFTKFLEGDIKDAAIKFKQSIYNINEKNITSVMYDCLSCFLGLRLTYDNDDEIVEILKKLFYDNVVDEVARACQNEETLKSAIFTDRFSRLCIIDWHQTDVRAEVFNKIQDIKRKFYI